MESNRLVSELDVITGAYGDLQLEIVAPGLSDLSTLNELPADGPKEIVGLIRILANNRSCANRSHHALLCGPQLEQRSEGHRTIALVENRRVQFIPSSHIQAIEAEGNYVRIHMETGSTLLRDTIVSVASRLAPMGFVRVHRSWILNIERIKEIEPLPHGKYVIVTSNGQRYLSSRTYRDAIDRFVPIAIGNESTLRHFTSHSTSRERQHAKLLPFSR